MFSASDSDTFGAAGESSSPPPPSRPRNSDLKQDDDDWPTEVRTLFVCGLAMDSKPRELYLLFRGYKVCALRYCTQLYCTSTRNSTVFMCSFSFSFDSIRFDSQGYEGSILKVTSKNGKPTPVCCAVLRISLRTYSSTSCRVLRSDQIHTDIKPAVCFACIHCDTFVRIVSDSRSDS